MSKYCSDKFWSLMNLDYRYHSMVTEPSKQYYNMMALREYAKELGWSRSVETPYFGVFLDATGFIPIDPK